MALLGRVFARAVRPGVTSYLFAGQMLAAGVAFLVNILAASVMDPSERGVLALLLQIAYLLTVAVLLGAERPFIASRQGSFPEMMGEFQRLVRPGWWFVLLPGAAAGYFFVHGDFHLWIAMSLLAVYLVCNALGRAIRIAYITSGTVTQFVWSTVSSQGGLLLLSVLLVLLNVDDPNVWFAAYTATALIMLGIAFLNTRRLRGPVSDDLLVIRLRGMKLIPASFGNSAMLRSDRLLLPLLASSAQLGIYVVVATVMEIGTWPVQQWADASLRRWSSKDFHSHRRVFFLIAKAGLVVLIITILCGILALIVVRSLLEPEYLPAQELIVPLGVAAIFYGMSRVQQGVLIAQGHAGRVSVVEMTGMIASVVAYIALIPLWGAMGAAVGSLLGYGICLSAGAIALWSSGRGQ